MKNYKEQIDGVGHVSLSDMACSQEVLERLQEVTAGHWLIIVETVIAWLKYKWLLYY